MAGSGNIWKKRLLIPLWVVQLIATVIFLGLSALALWYWNRVSGTVESEYPDLVDGEDLDDFDDAIEYA